MRRSRNQRYDFFLIEMHDAADRILKYTEGMDFDSFVSDSKIRDAVIRNFEIIGEAVKHIPFSFQKLHRQLPWQQMLNLRNFIVHEFFDVDDDIIWSIITHDLRKNRDDLAIIAANFQRYERVLNTNAHPGKDSGNFH